MYCHLYLACIPDNNVIYPEQFRYYSDLKLLLFVFGSMISLRTMAFTPIYQCKSIEQLLPFILKVITL